MNYNDTLYFFGTTIFFLSYFVLLLILIYGYCKTIYDIHYAYEIIKKKTYISNKKITNDTVPILHNKVRKIIESKIKPYKFFTYGVTTSLDEIKILIKKVKKPNTLNRILLIEELIYNIDNKSIYIYVLHEADVFLDDMYNVYNSISLYEN